MPPRRSMPRTTKVEKEDKTTWGSGGLFQNRSLGSLALILLCPGENTLSCLQLLNSLLLLAHSILIHHAGVVITFWYTLYRLDGSLFKLYEAIMKQGFMFFYNIWPTPFSADGTRSTLHFVSFHSTFPFFIQLCG